MNAQNDSVFKSTLSAKGPLRYEFLFNEEIQQFVHQWKQSVGNQESPQTRRFGDLVVEIRNDNNRCVSELTFQTIHTGDKTDGAFLSRPNVEDVHAVERLMPFIGKFTITKQVVAKGAQPSTLTFLLIKSEVIYMDEVHAIKVDYAVTAFHTLTSSSKDQETDFPVTVVREILSNNPGISGSAGVQDEVEQLDELHWLRTRSTLNFPGSVISYDNIRFTFPALLLGWSTSSIYLEAQGRTFFVMHPQIRQEETKIVMAKLTTTFTAVIPELPSLFSFKTEDLRYDGIIFNVDVRQCLFNDGSLSCSTHSEDSFWGPLIAETFTWGFTNVTASEYLGMVGELKNIGFTSTKWKYNLYKNVLSQITLE